jgi:hypothetical protein
MPLGVFSLNLMAFLMPGAALESLGASRDKVKKITSNIP